MIVPKRDSPENDTYRFWIVNVGKRHFAGGSLYFPFAVRGCDDPYRRAKDLAG